MLRSILVSPSPLLTANLRTRLNSSRASVIVKEFGRHPSVEELSNAIRAHDPQLVFVDVANDAAACQMMGDLQRRWPQIFFVAADVRLDPEKLIGLMRSGIRELVAECSTEAEFAACLERVRSHCSCTLTRTNNTDQATNAVYAFLPAKPGTGASTLAVNTALAFSRLENNRTLLIDLDMGCGVTRFHLKAEHPYSVHDAFERSAILEPGLWADLAANCGRMDLLATAPPGPAERPSTETIGPLFEFARRHYDSIVLDCSGDLDAFTLECLGQCRRILLIAEPDLTTVHLGREKLRILHSAELEDRVELVINRWRKQPVLSLADMEGVLGISADHLAPEDAKTAYQGVLRGCGVDPATPLGKACQAIQESLGAPCNENRPSTANPGARKRMVEYFAVSPARYSTFPNAR